MMIFYNHASSDLPVCNAFGEVLIRETIDITVEFTVDRYYGLFIDDSLYFPDRLGDIL